MRTNRQPKQFTVTKHLPDNLGSIEFSGTVRDNDAEQYEITQVLLLTNGSGCTLAEDMTEFFNSHRALVNPEFHHDDITELLAEWLDSDEATLCNHPLKDAA